MIRELVCETGKEASLSERLQAGQETGRSQAMGLRYSAFSRNVYRSMTVWLGVLNP